MPKIFDRLDDKKSKDLRVLRDFVAIFCRENHRTESKNTFSVRDARLHQALGELLSHGMAKLLQCPYDPKPMCKKCETHCYAPGYRERIREVMRFSGRHLIKHGRLDLMLHYLF